MKPEYLGLSAVGWKLMIESWWDKVLAGILLGSIVLGCLYICYRIFRKVLNVWRRRHQQVKVPTAVGRYLDRLRTDGKKKRFSLLQNLEIEAKSFGVYLGQFASPPTAAQTKLLSKWDVVVLDPFEAGVLGALSISSSKSLHVLGRLDVQVLLKTSDISNNNEVIQSIGIVAQAIISNFKNGRDDDSPFTGVLLTNFDSHFQPVIFNELATYIRTLGLDVWLEMSPPRYLPEETCRDINMKYIKGIVYRNGNIGLDGDRKNYFQMAEMRTAMRSIAAQRVSHGPPMFLWETVDDVADLKYAVVQRCYNWCRYNSAVCWIGSESALTNAETAASETVDDKPLGALMWLKNEDVMKAHTLWRQNDQISEEPYNHDELFDSLQLFVPNLSHKLKAVPSQDYVSSDCRNQVVALRDSILPYRKRACKDPLSRSAEGNDLSGLGSFHLGLEVGPEEFTDIRQTQRNLKELGLLQRIGAEDLCRIGENLATLQSSTEISALLHQDIKELVQLLVQCDGDHSRLQIYVGLHSGFQTSSNIQFWGLYDLEAGSNILNIYVSGRATDRAGTILHTFLSSRGHTRTECFMVEYALSKETARRSIRWQLPDRIVSDIERLSPAEIILFLGRLVEVRPEHDSALFERIRQCCTHQIMEVPTLTQLRASTSTSYLANEITIEELVASRLTWLREHGKWTVDQEAAISVVREIDARLHGLLMGRQSDLLAQLSVVIQALVTEDHMDTAADIFALGIFNAFRKLALDEIYLEVLDRNPLPNHAADQAGCYAENFALGSSCESFFDMTPKSLGRIISDRYRAYYMQFQPPPREEGFTELPTAYAAMQIDMDPQDGQENIPLYYRVTFLGIFALPALIDIGLLTTVGRGLYLTTFMTSTQKTMATTALMLALLVCGAVGSWISSGGSYYLYANAFPAMNMFVLTRFVAGIAIILVGGFFGMIAIIVSKGILAALVFFFYFAMLTTYLLTLSALSIYQVPGSRFQSGRTVIMTCVPILFISPILSLWLKHDITIYPCVLTCFVISLMLGARNIMSQWSTWYLKIPFVTDAEVADWFIATRQEKNSLEEFGPDIGELVKGPLPRRELHKTVLKERDRPFWRRSSTDPLIKKLASGYDSTLFLMSWYCKFKRTKMPLPYSATWNLTLKAGLENMTNMQKGLKIHSAFLHWRHTGDDIWSGFLYFVVALLDKWAALVSGGALVGLSAASSTEYRLAVGFGLCYYLIGAVSLDTVSQPLWTAANQATIQPITSLTFLHQATKNDARARRRLYWQSLAKFFFMHIWGITVTSSLMWLFEGSRSATIMYFAYIGAYTGLLWYQYNKIYCGKDSAKCLALASIVGLPAGIALHVCLPRFAFSGVICLATGTWTAAIYSLWMAGIGWPNLFNNSASQTRSNELENLKSRIALYFCTALEPYPEYSQSTLSAIFDSISSLSVESRFLLEPLQHPGTRVMEILTGESKKIHMTSIEDSFPSAEHILQQTAELWSSGKTVVHLIASNEFTQQGRDLRSVSKMKGDQLHLYIILGMVSLGEQPMTNISRNWKIIAEGLVQATCESHLGLSHDSSMLAELLVTDHINSDKISIPEGIKRQLETSLTERARIMNSGYKKTYLRYLLLGIDCETEWDTLPSSIRQFLFKRCCGQHKNLSVEETTWIQKRFGMAEMLDAKNHIAQCELGASLTVAVYAYAKDLETGILTNGDNDESKLVRDDLMITPRSGGALKSDPGFMDLLSQARWKVKIALKFLVLSLTADPEYQRELDYTLRAKPLFLHWPITICLNGIWSFCKALQGIIFPLVFFHARKSISELHSNMKGMKTVVEKRKITIETLSGPSTCFVKSEKSGVTKLSQYTGRLDSEPADTKQLIAINTYTNKFVLSEREEYRSQEVINSFVYEYPQGKTKNKFRFPIQRICLKGESSGQIVQYDERGYITTGSTFQGVNPVKFTYWYRKSAKFDDELLRGEYIFPHITIKVSWCMPPQYHPERLDEWISFSKVTEATFIENSNIYHAEWIYDHKFHPEIATTLNGESVSTPPMIREDWFHVLSKPEKCGFLSDNPLLSFSSFKSNWVSRLLHLNIKRYPIPTSHARTQLWRTWKATKELDAVTVRWLDEGLLRSDEILRPYWRNRDIGRLDTAKHYLDQQANTIMARTDVDPEVSSWVHIAFKISDFYSFGQGGDTRINTRTVSSQLRDSDDELHVLAMDTSTWPNEPGGVSACRRDMVNDLKTIRWHIMAESANDYGVPKFQIERNVQSLTVLPLWGLDFLNPTHGVLQNSLDSAVVERSYNTTSADIKQNFLPILTSLVRCSRTLHIKATHIEEATKALVNLNAYFESHRNWNDVWNSDAVKQKWRELWLTEEVDDALPLSKWWDFEKPTMQEMDQALNMWHRYLFIFSVPLPERIPDVFQASHHFTGATYGILCKVKRNCTLHVWDHCISFRELVIFMSSAVSFDTPFVNSSLISLGYLGCVLLEHHADVVLPCAAYFNPGWEIELGTAEGTLEHRRTFARKIDPVVNGICNMEKFEPIKTIKTAKPTVIMLSHVQYVKDIKNAILAADLIVNKWGFSDYSIHIYGDMERAAGHSTECQELIASKGLGTHCILKGLGNPYVVLQDAWLFLNSSISEGLPLAMGEAALTGVPVVCTDVGASFCVVTDSTTGDRFSEVVPPNDSESLARAQISILGLLGRWSSYAEDAPGVSPPVLAYPTPTPEQVKQITQRMYDKTEQRRRLGMLGRENVLKNFSSERYLREHEQLLWIGKYRSPTYHARSTRPSSLKDSSQSPPREKSYFRDSMVRPPLRGHLLTGETLTPGMDQRNPKQGAVVYSDEIDGETAASFSAASV